MRGLYLAGDVGRGKTMLMDLFYDAVPLKAKRRVHFHQFMSEVHAAIIAFRASDKGRNTDPVAAVAKPLVASLKLLCLDEFHVHDITNAMLLQRLFEKLFEGGVTLVATSNVVPDRLYENGLNRQLFLPFIALLKANTELVTLDGPTDYRRAKLAGEDVYFFGPDAKAGLDRLWHLVVGEAEEAPRDLKLGTRRLHVPRAVPGAARFAFTDLCERPYGAFDYLRLAQAFETILIEDVPRFERTRSDAAKRFILLIDTLHDRGVKLAASFAAPLEHLAQDERTRFEFARTISRLLEMRSADYLEAPLRS